MHHIIRMSNDPRDICICKKLYNKEKHQKHHSRINQKCIAREHICICYKKRGYQRCQAENVEHPCICKRHSYAYKSCKAVSGHPCVCTKWYVRSDKHFKCKSDSHKCTCEKRRVIFQQCNAESHPCICLKAQQYMNFNFVCKANIGKHPCICYLDFNKCKTRNHECICSSDSNKKHPNCKNKHEKKKVEKKNINDTIVSLNE